MAEYIVSARKYRTVRFSEMVPGSSQLNLFDDTEKESRLLEAMDKIRDRFGKGAVRRGGK